MKIRIANIIEDGRIAGPQIRMLSVARALKTHNIETIIIYPKQDSKDFESRINQYSIDSKKMRITRLSKNFRDILFYLLSFPFEILMIYKYLKHNNFKYVH